MSSRTPDRMWLARLFSYADAHRPRMGVNYAPPGWYADGEIMRAAYVSHEQDDDWGQPGTMVREILDDATRQRTPWRMTCSPSPP